MEQNKLLTVFTPTYNRAYILPKLYQSLLNQTNKNFEWLIIDDGSTDDTEKLIQSFILDDFLEIRYFKQSNGGKHRAINRGISLAQYELFFIVDSDDQLADYAVDFLTNEYLKIQLNSDFAGISGIRAYFNGEKIGGGKNFGILDCNTLDFRYKYNIKGDMAEVYKTDILRQYLFPEFDNENFCPEALVWNRIALKYKIRYTHEKIYLCDYLPDGLTAKITPLRMNSPESSLLCYSELSKMPVPLLVKMKSYINFWRFSFNSKSCFNDKLKMGGKCSILFYVLGYLMYKKDKYKI